MTPSPQQQWEETIGDILMNLAMNSAISRNRNERPVSEALQTINKAVEEIVIRNDQVGNSLVGTVGMSPEYVKEVMDANQDAMSRNKLRSEQRAIIGGES